MNNAMRELAKNARSRLAKRSEFREQNKSMNLRAEKNFLATTTIDEKEQKAEKEFEEKVLEIENSGNVLNPIMQFVDKKLFEQMDEASRERTVLKIANKYVKVRDKLMESGEIFN